MLGSVENLRTLLVLPVTIWSHFIPASRPVCMLHAVAVQAFRQCFRLEDRCWDSVRVLH